MKKLLWKELYEQRFIPLAYGALVAVVTLAWYGVSVWMAAHDHRPNDVITAQGASGIVVIFGCILGLFPGSGAIASEVGQGTLNFLSVLPANRSHIWKVKVWAGLITVVLSLISISIAYLLVGALLFGADCLTPIINFLEQWRTRSINVRLFVIVLSALVILYGYAVSLFFSTVVDRTITAAVLGLIGGIGVAFVGGEIVGYFNSDNTVGAHILLFLTVFADAAFLSASFVAFCKGDAMRLGKHVKIAAGVLLGWVIVGGISLGIYGQAEKRASLNGVISPLSITQPAATWNPPAGYADNFTRVRANHWNAEPVHGVETRSIPANYVAKMPPVIPAADMTLIKECQESLLGTVSYGGKAPDYIKNKIERVLAAHPHFFYAEYRLAVWYAQGGDLASYRLWRDRSLTDAPAILAGRMQYDNGKPVVGADTSLSLSYYKSDSYNEEWDKQIHLTYEELITDNDGCYYLPVYKGIYESSSHGWTNNTNGIPTVMGQVTKTMAFEQGSAGRFRFDSRVGLLPPMIARSYIVLNGTAAQETKSDKPARISSYSLDVSWQPYPKADYYTVGLTEIIQHPSKDKSLPPSTSYYPLIDNGGLHLTSTHWSLNFSGTPPIFNRHHTCVLHITAWRGNPGQSAEQYADSRDFFFIPDKGLAPLPMTKVGIQAAIPTSVVQSLSIDPASGRTIVQGTAEDSQLFHLDELNEREVFLKRAVNIQTTLSGRNNGTGSFKLEF